MKSLIMSGNHPTLILSGRKTQTRRVMKPQPDDKWKFGGLSPSGLGLFRYADDANMVRLIEPRYRVGDLAYIKEAWLELRRSHYAYDYLDKSVFIDILNRKNGYAYKADATPEGDEIRAEYGYKWQSPLFMPEWASRITVRITRVWAERVQEISSSDAIAEGVCHSEFWKPSDVEGKPFEDQWHDDHQFWSRYPQIAYAKLWDSINGKTHPWESNPFVWAYEFEVVK